MRAKNVVAALGVLSVLLLACEGDQGQAGPAGAQGDPGPAGAAGAAGEAGAAGAAGAKGDPGDNGTNGVACWDDNGNGSCDLGSEDENGDGACNSTDCVTERDLPPSEIPIWNSADPINRRVHAVHAGAELHYPNQTVAHADDPADRNWEIHMPLDLRECEVCHTAETSGTWMTNPGRLPCSGCHDSDAVKGHINSNTWDPTPEAPFSGDEVEACGTCHTGSKDEAVSKKHGTDVLLTEGDFAPCVGSANEDCGKYFANVEITAIDGNAGDGTGVKVTFTLKDAAGNGIDIANPATFAEDMDFSITRLVNDGISNQWVPLIYQNDVAIDADGADGADEEWETPPYAIPAADRHGIKTQRGTRLGSDAELPSGSALGTFTNLGGGTYEYTFPPLGGGIFFDEFCWDENDNLACDASEADDAADTDDCDEKDCLDSEYMSAGAIAWAGTATHRITVYVGGHEGPTGVATQDFIPNEATGAPGVFNASALATRDIVQTAACKSCHGFDFHGHGGDRLTVEDCTQCHNPSMINAWTGRSLDLGEMIHAIHAGPEYPTAAGADGVFWDDPDTAADESEDNKGYKVWRTRGSSTRIYDFSKVEFPARIENCTKCHYGNGADVDAFKTNFSKRMCTSCHVNVSFVDPAPAGTVLHSGGAVASDGPAVCASTCHTEDTDPSAALGPNVLLAHNWDAHDARKVPEFDVELTVSSPTNDEYFENGEAPVVTLKLKDKATGNALDHTTVAQDDAAEGCKTKSGLDQPAGDCPARDGLFRSAYLFVHGPRARRNPVLGTAAHAEVVSSSAGPFDLSAADASLDLVVDGGQTVIKRTPSGGDVALGAYLSVDVEDGTFADVAAATVDEIIAWLNADDDFTARAIAYKMPAGVRNAGNLAIRSRNLGTTFAVQLAPSVVTRVVFNGDTSYHPIDAGSSYPRNVLYKHTDPLDDDPKVAWFSDRIEYTLDAVDDLVPGTYTASVEIADRGNRSSTNFWTPSVATVTFQVKMKDEEKPVARNCNACHQSDEETGTGQVFVLDYRRHNKSFFDNALDQCGGCHGYQEPR